MPRLSLALMRSSLDRQRLHLFARIGLVAPHFMHICFESNLCSASGNFAITLPPFFYRNKRMIFKHIDVDILLWRNNPTLSKYLLLSFFHYSHFLFLTKGLAILATIGIEFIEIVLMEESVVSCGDSYDEGEDHMS
jgi:hypothetical protein